MRPSLTVTALLFSGILFSGCSEFRYKNYPKGSTEFMPKCMLVYRSFGELALESRKRCERACLREGPESHRRILERLGVWEVGQRISRNAPMPESCARGWDWCENKLLDDAGIGRSMQDARRVCDALCANYGHRTGSAILQDIILETRRWK